VVREVGELVSGCEQETVMLQPVCLVVIALNVSQPDNLCRDYDMLGIAAMVVMPSSSPRRR
jgi:hypothetical protein